MIGAELVAQMLADAGVPFISALCGNGINSVLHATRAAGVRVIDTRCEQAASYLAETYARFTGRVGVCAVSASVGHTNALAGVVNARFDGAPMLLLSGSSEHRLTDRGKFQDFDQVALAAPATKYARLVDTVEKIPFYMHEAFAQATSGRPGPVHLTIPNDVLEAEVSVSPWPRLAPDAGIVRQEAAPVPTAVAAAAHALMEARRPLLVAGSGVFYSGGQAALTDFATMTDIPVVVPIWDRGTLPAPLPQYMGVIGAASGGPDLLARADLVILAGARVDYRVGYLQPPAVRPDARLIRIDVDPYELHQGRPAGVAVHASPRLGLEALSARLAESGAAKHSAWLAEAQAGKRQFYGRWQETPPAGRETATSGAAISGQDVVHALAPFVGPATPGDGEAVFLVDGGNIGQWAHMTLATDRYPGHWMTCGASGVVGYGLAGAMAARLAYPDRPVILLSGDGSMGFTALEFESAVRQNLPFVAIVANDSRWGITSSNQIVRYGADDTVAVNLGMVRFDLLAESMGALGLCAGDAAGLQAAIRQGLASGRPTLIHVPITHGGPAD